MSTVKTTNLQHPSAGSPAIVLDADGGVSINNDLVVTDDAGNVGIGTSLPQNKLHVLGEMRLEPQAGDYFSIRQSPRNTNLVEIIGNSALVGNGMQFHSGALNNGPDTVLKFSSDTTSTRYAMGFYHSATTSTNGTSIGGITFSSAGTSYLTSSDYRLKQDVEKITGALGRLEKLKPIRFAWKSDPSFKVDGFLAHEAQEVVPESVSGKKDGVGENGTPIYQGIDQSKLVPLLVAAVQELAAEVAELKAAQK